jgi:hypothetical protein
VARPCEQHSVIGRKLLSASDAINCLGRAPSRRDNAHSFGKSVRSAVWRSAATGVSKSGQRGIS